MPSSNNVRGHRPSQPNFPVHSIKGNSGMFGFTAVSQFTHKNGVGPDQLRSSQMVVTVEVTDLLLQSLDCLKTLIDCAKSGEAPNDAVVSGLGARPRPVRTGASAAKQGLRPPH